MTARFSWNQRNTRGHRPRLQQMRHYLDRLLTKEGLGSSRGQLDNRMKREDIGEANSPKEPVCGMTVRQKADTLSYEYNGQTFFFCCSGCLNKFKETPSKFLVKPEPPSPLF